MAVGSNSNEDWKHTGQCEVEGLSGIVAIAAGKYHTVCVKADGSVISIGDKSSNQNNVYGWTNIVAVDASSTNTVGLSADGTVVVAGSDSKGQCKVDGWKNIKQPVK